MPVRTTDLGVLFFPGRLGRIIGAVVAILFVVIGAAIMVLARGPAMPGPLFVVVASIVLAAIVRSIGLELRVDDHGISQTTALAGGWSVVWSDIAEWQLIRVRSSYGIVFVDGQGQRYRVSSQLELGSEMRPLLARLEQKLGPPQSD
jgi:hypothetical protein